MATKVEKKKTMKVETPYPSVGINRTKEAKKKQTLSDTVASIDFIGDELVKLSNRLNEIELSFHEMDAKLKQIAGRMGL